MLRSQKRCFICPRCTCSFTPSPFRDTCTYNEYPLWQKFRTLILQSLSEVHTCTLILPSQKQVQTLCTVQIRVFRGCELSALSRFESIGGSDSLYFSDSSLSEIQTLCTFQTRSFSGPRLYATSESESFPTLTLLVLFRFESCGGAHASPFPDSSLCGVQHFHLFQIQVVPPLQLSVLFRFGVFPNLRREDFPDSESFRFRDS